jgi:hypothetical protein
MNSIELIRLMNRPRLLDSQTLVQTGQLLEKFPYCQCLLMLYLKNLHKIDTEGFKPFLENNAALVPDRAKLFRLIHGIDDQPLIPHEVFSVFSLEQLEENADKDEMKKSFSVEKDYLSKDEMPHRTFDPKTSVTYQYDDDSEDPAEIDEPGENLYNDMDFITETLAEVFVSKRNFVDAIKTYEKLCLKYPEKNSYFAARIEKLKNNL